MVTTDYNKTPSSLSTVVTVSVNILRQCDGVHHQGEDKEEGEQLQSQPRRLHSVQGLGEETFPEHTFT